jgi:hypothetical protein
VAPPKAGSPAFAIEATRAAVGQSMPAVCHRHAHSAGMACTNSLFRGPVGPTGWPRRL